MDEERRLAYVAMTRAMTRLYLSDSEGLTGDGIYKLPSRFIFDAGKENLCFVRELDPSLEMRSRSAASFFPSELFVEGDRVGHEVFGPGTIVAVDPRASAYTIRFDNLPTERTLRLGARLQKL